MRLRKQRTCAHAIGVARHPPRKRAHHSARHSNGADFNAIAQVEAAPRHSEVGGGREGGRSAHAVAIPGYPTSRKQAHQCPRNRGHLNLLVSAIHNVEQRTTPRVNKAVEWCTESRRGANPIDIPGDTAASKHIHHAALHRYGADALTGCLCNVQCSASGVNGETAGPVEGSSRARAICVSCSAASRKGPHQRRTRARQDAHSIAAPLGRVHCATPRIGRRG